MIELEPKSVPGNTAGMYYCAGSGLQGGFLASVWNG